MKVLIISTTDVAGGAAIAASRLAAGLLLAGAEVKMLVKEKVGKADWVETQAAPDEPSSAWMSNLNAYVNKAARSGTSNTSFSLPWPGQSLAAHPLVAWADVVNLHWVAGFVTPETLRELLASGKPVVWTLHDERAFTGGCHYASGCEGFLSECASCPQLQPAFQSLPSKVLQLSVEALRGPAPMTVVSPSRWLGNEARRSRFFAGCRVDIIPYGIDLDVFKPGDKTKARKALRLPEKALVFLFGAFTLAEHRKGFDLLRTAIGNALAQPDIAVLHASGALVFAAYGKDEKSIVKSGLPIRLLGSVDNEPAMAAMLSAGDVVICPTREDNLPNVVMEAMACGIPVLSCEVGGVPDMVNHGVNGCLVPGEDAEALGEALIKLIRKPSELPLWGAAARAKCEAEYPLRRQGEAYGELMGGLVTTPALESASSSFEVARTELLKAMAEAQGLQAAALTAEVAELKANLKIKGDRSAQTPTVRGALKIVEQELKAQRRKSSLSFLSFTVWALKVVRDLLRRIDKTH